MPSRKPVEVEVEIDRTPKVRKTRVTKPETVVEEKALFNPLADIDDEIDQIEKSYALTGSSLGGDEDRQHTGLLELDLILGKGIKAGWYTFFGAEQSCKSTGASTWMTAALTSDVPIIQYWDYEGCFSLNAVLNTNYGEITFRKVLEILEIPEEAHEDKSFIDISAKNLQVETLGQMVKVDKLYYSGIKNTSVLKTEGGLVFEGHAHPILVVNGEGDLVYRYQELLLVGDKVVVKKR